MRTDSRGILMLSFLLVVLLPIWARPQSFNASITGTVSDPAGAVVPSANLSLRAIGTGATSRTTSDSAGLYSFPNLPAGAYELTAHAPGFRDFIQRGIVLQINENARLDLKLELGEARQTVEVSADVTPLNFENAQLVEGITPQSIKDLPLLISGAIRSAAQFAILMPGVNTGAGNSGFDARIDGGMKLGDEAVLDGVTIQDGMKTVSGMTEAYTDHPMSPESISEISLLTSNYEPQYGATTSGVITAVTKSGTNEFHGDLYEFLRNTALNARQFGIPNRPKDVENDFGGTIGGPLKIPWLAWTGRKKTYFFVGYELFHIRGGTTTPVISIPSLKERQGDFSDWVDSSGKLIPVYDPATTRPNPLFDPNHQVGPSNMPFFRDQFMGCDGKTPNVICPSDPRLQNSLAQQWFKFLPSPTFTGALNNYVVPEPVPTTVFSNGSLLDVRVDHYLGDKDHFTGAIHYHGSSASRVSELPVALSTDARYFVDYGFQDRLNWDHTFSPTLLNHAAFGYNDLLGIYSCLDGPFANKLPQISGVANHLLPPVITFQDFSAFGCNTPGTTATPTYVVNDLMTWVHGKHTLKAGGEVRWLEFNDSNVQNNSGTFAFARTETGLTGLNSGNAIASFLLEQVDQGSVGFQTVSAEYPRSRAWNLHVGDTWKLTPKLSLNYGLRWDVFPPSVEKFDNTSFLDPVGPNPGAGNRLGRLAFAGTKWGAASFGRRAPENTWHGGFGPRLGFAYGVTTKTVARAGYGIFYSSIFYPSWNGGISWDGFNTNAAFSSSQGGLQAAFILSQGFPQNFPHPPLIDSAADNGLGSIFYRPFDADRLPYAQQWNLTLEHQFTGTFYVSGAYVANKGTRLNSQTLPINALSPSLLAMGQKLYDQFQPAQTSLDGVPVPYPGWIQQMTACAPTVAQALTPYPQYCSALRGANENLGSSTYHSFQLKAENRFSHGIWFLGAYTASKLLTNADSVQSAATLWSGAHGSISPFERQ